MAEANLAATGERMIPGLSDDRTYWEHVYRYRFALPFVQGKRVADVACGEGYGTAALLVAGARSVLGVDRSEEACRHARQKYGVKAIAGCALDLPLATRSVDLVVSFETIEHLPDPARFLEECRRVLAPAGMLLVSTPNITLHRERVINPFHCSEMTLAEFEMLLERCFRRRTMFSQCSRAKFGPAIRSLAAKLGAGWALEAVTRLRSRWTPVAPPPAAQAGPAECRAVDAVATILSGEPGLERGDNPFMVVPLRRGSLPEYFIAAAEL